ncbi:MAG: hypothetical protein GY793_09730 [Proteobacteria bacterium]|nr:hypothetical protein [Pseudomonadota bacterium]
MNKFLLFIFSVAVIVLAVFYIAPNLITSKAEKALSKTLHTPVKIEGLKLSIIDHSVNVDKITVKNYPEFSDNNDLFVLKNTSMKFKPMSIFSKLVDITEFNIDSIEIKFIGGLDQNNLIHLANLLALNNLDKSENKDFETEQQVSKGKDEYKLKIGSLLFKEFKVALQITNPVKVPEQSFKFNNFELRNIGGEKGMTPNDIMIETVENIQLALVKGIQKVIPEPYRLIINTSKSLSDGKKFIKDTVESESFQEKLKKSRSRAKRLLNKVDGYLK